MFDESGITQDDWISYPILTMADIPEIKVVLLNNPKVGSLRRRFGSGECTGCAGYRSGPPRRNRKGDSAASAETRIRAGGVEGLTEQATRCKHRVTNAASINGV